MTIDQTQLATIIMAVAALLGVVGTNVVNVIVALRTRKDVVAEVGAVATKADAIHSLVDGNASKAADQIRDLQTKLEGLHAQLLDVMEKRVDDAKAAPPTNPPRPLPVVFVDQRASSTNESPTPAPGHAPENNKR